MLGERSWARGRRGQQAATAPGPPSLPFPTHQIQTPGSPAARWGVAVSVNPPLFYPPDPPLSILPLLSCFLTSFSPLLLMDEHSVVIQEHTAHHGRIFMAVTVPLMFLSLIPFCVRIYVRVWPSLRFRIDDWLIIGGFVSRLLVSNRHVPPFQSGCSSLATPCPCPCMLT